MSEYLYYDLKSSAYRDSCLPAQVARELGLRIISGAFETDNLLEDEGQISSRYKVSKIVVRNALRILAGKGMLSIERRAGIKVTERSQWALLDNDVLAWHLSSKPNFDFIDQLMEARFAFEPRAAGLAAQRVNDDQLGKITSSYNLMMSKTDVEELTMANALFHKTILSLSQNEVLKAMDGVVYSAVLLSTPLVIKDIHKPEAGKFYQSICDSIANREAETAEKNMELLLSHLLDCLKATRLNRARSVYL